MLKMYQELEHTFSVVSLGTEVFKIGEAGGGSGLDSSAFQTLPSGVHKIGYDFHTLKKTFLYIFFDPKILVHVLAEFSKIQ